MNWSEVIGQEDIKQKLTSMVDDEHVPHAMILCGPYGCGKMAMAMAMASYLLTEGSVRINPQFNKANSEAMLGQWEHPDLHFSFPTIKRTGMSADHQPVSGDYAKEWRQMLMQGPYFNISQWMDYMDAANQQAIITGAESDELARKLSLKSSLGGYKVAVIWLPERMNLTSANKLLKLLEEPPHQTIFIMASEEPEKLLDTIKSRTQRIDMKRLTNKDICDALVQQRGIDDASAQRIARLANGNWMNALDALNTSNENRQFFDMFTMLMRLAYTRNIKELKKWSEAVAAYGREKQRRMLVYFIGQVRENFMYNFRNPELTYMTVEEENFSKKFSPFINELNVIEISELMERANRDIGQNANAKVVMFDMALKMIVLLLRK
ncbi:MAG: DNA polymerase III subunit delta [Prevotella sp.]|nr:DNA polymerase III subunit delta [Prevotella sp.]